MKIVKFVKNGDNISDFEVQQQVQNFIESTDRVWQVTNHLVITEFRALIKEKKINKDDYAFFVQDFAGDIHQFIVDKDGRSHRYYDSQDIWEDMVTRLL